MERHSKGSLFLFHWWRFSAYIFYQSSWLNLGHFSGLTWPLDQLAAQFVCVKVGHYSITGYTSFHLIMRSLLFFSPTSAGNCFCLIPLTVGKNLCEVHAVICHAKKTGDFTGINCGSNIVKCLDFLGIRGEFSILDSISSVYSVYMSTWPTCGSDFSPSLNTILPRALYHGLPSFNQAPKCNPLGQ